MYILWYVTCMSKKSKFKDFYSTNGKFSQNESCLAYYFTKYCHFCIYHAKRHHNFRTTQAGFSRTVCSFQQRSDPHLRCGALKQPLHSAEHQSSAEGLLLRPSMYKNYYRYWFYNCTRP